MKIKTLILISCAAAVISAPAHAIQPYFQMNVGYAAAVFNNYADNSAFAISGTFGVMGSSGLRAGISPAARMGLGGGDISINNYSAMLDAAYEIPTGGMIRPFIGATGGIMYSTINIRDVGSDSRTDFVYGPMAGITYAVGPNAAIDFTYRYLFLNNIDTGLAARFGGFSVGGRYSF